MIARTKAHRWLVVMVAVFSIVGISTSSLAQGKDMSRWKATPLTSDSQFQSSETKTEHAQPAAARIAAASNGRVAVIVKLTGDALASYTGDLPGLAATSPHITGAPRLDPTNPASQLYLAHLQVEQSSFAANVSKVVPQAIVTNHFTVVLNAVSMVVPADQVDSLRTLPGVENVYPDSLLQLDEDRSPSFIGAPTVWKKDGGQESAGEGVIVGVLDSGVWPEHPSFSDPDPSGKAYAAPPDPAAGDTRACAFAGGAHPGPSFACNNKLIGADRFMATYQATTPLEAGEFTSARDDDGHGTHTASTAAGNANVKASIFGRSIDTVSGIAPRAHVMVYKVCGASGCFSSDSAAAVQKAILDGVNVINFSVSGGANPYSDPVEQAFLDAYNAGVFVAASAGNSGPTPETTDHRGPWVTTVAASTLDRSFTSTARIVAANGDTVQYTGTTITNGAPSAPVVNAGAAPYNDPYCLSSTADNAFSGKIVVCERGGGPGRVQKGYNVKQRGAVGMILYNNAANVTDQETDNHFLPAIHITYSDGVALIAFLANHSGATASWPMGEKSKAKGDVMASFSSRGGPGQTLGVSKPDITAPGVQILAGHTPQSVDIATGPQGELFQAIAGTSMSSPHVAGAGAMIKALHPDWTPGQIKSALMTTANTKVVKEDGKTKADHFDDGSGRVNLSKAGDPGATFDVSAADYRAHADDLYHVNYPSIYVPSLAGVLTLQRTVHSVATSQRTWRLDTVDAPDDVKITLPEKITLAPGADATFDITIDARLVALGQVRQFEIKLTSGNYLLHIPVTFVRGQAALSLNKTCDPATLSLNSTTTCTITVTNPGFTAANVTVTDNLPSKLKLQASSVVNATASGNTVTWSGSLPASAPPTVAIGPGASPAGSYVPLSGYGIAPISDMRDETITNFTVPAFTYAGETYTRVGVVSNGYVVVGGGDNADITYLNQNLPNPARPNNVLAPYWTDLDPGVAGTVSIGTLTDGTNTWLVVDWNSVPEHATNNANSFEIWIGLNSNSTSGSDISYAYGTIQGNGKSGALTVGAENKFGTSGANIYYNGAGTLPGEGTQLRVTNTPATAGTRVITFKATGANRGKWTNYAALTGDGIDGTSIVSFSGEVK